VVSSSSLELYLPEQHGASNDVDVSLANETALSEL
jgi:hypothetical protein